MTVQITSGMVAEKAQRLLDGRRVFLRPGGRAVVFGDHAVYEVVATPAGVGCSCVARGRCSHALAAMLAWAEAEAVAR